MTRPGVQVTSTASVSPRSMSANSGKWFVAGATEKGPIDKAVTVKSIQEFEAVYGTRQTYSLLWDSLDVFFKEGGTETVVARVSGPSASIATKTFKDSESTPNDSLKISAKNPGVWGNSLSVAIETSTVLGHFVIVATHSTLGEVERSFPLGSQLEAVSWGLSSKWLNVEIAAAGSTNNPAPIAATPLIGGADDLVGITDQLRADTLGLFTPMLGTGQVSVPGSVSSDVRSALLLHAKNFNRMALLDATDTGTANTLIAEATALLDTDHEYGALFAPWVRVPGIVTNTLRTVPPTALVAGLISRNDAQNNPNTPAAGENGVAQYVVDVVQIPWSDTVRQTLNEASVNVIRESHSGICLYGYRTLAKLTGNRAWLSLANQRLRNTITFEAELIAERFLFNQLDGKGHKVSEFGGALTAMLNRYWSAGALFGETADQAYNVDVSSSVNTIETLQNGELNAVLQLKMSPFSELVQLRIVKVALTETV